MIKRRNKRNKTDIMKSIIQNGVRVEKYKNKQEREINISQQLKKYEEENKRIEQRKEKHSETRSHRAKFLVFS